MQALPDSVQMIADVIGVEATLHLIASLPRAFSKGHPAGQPILYVPKNISPAHRLAEQLTFPVAQKLSVAFGGEILYPAACDQLKIRYYRARAVDEMFAKGMRKIEIATMLQIDEKTVGRVARTGQS